MEHILIIGGGGTGAALAHDLSLRGFKVTVFERGELLSGTTGRNHGLLHSGGRYAVNDPEAARECIQENRILRRIAPQALEQNDGLFVALTEKDMAYSRAFLEACETCGIPTQKLNPQEALAIEPALNPQLKLAVQVPDATLDAWRLPMHFYATARHNGAEINPFTEVIDLLTNGRTITGVRIFNHRTHLESEISGDLVVNAAGPWAGKICAMAGVHLPIQPGPGVMVAIDGRLTDMVINRLNQAGEGDIIVPQRELSILGTTLWLAQEPDGIDVPASHITQIVDLCSQMVPAVQSAGIRSVWCAARPLIKSDGLAAPQQISRTFDCFDHRQTDQIEGFVSIIGGKACTLRAMAEKTADVICRKTGRNRPCRTHRYQLLNYRHFYRTETRQRF